MIPNTLVLLLVILILRKDPYTFRHALKGNRHQHRGLEARLVV